jgi:hypothetical protein
MTDEPRIQIPADPDQLTPFERNYRRHPKAEERALLAQSASECLTAAMIHVGWTAKRLRKELGWSKRKWNAIVNDGRITLRQMTQILYVIGYRATFTATPIPNDLRKLTHGEPEPAPALES